MAECLFTNDALMIGCAVLVKGQWYYVTALGKRPGTVVCIGRGDNKDAKPTFTYDELEEIL